MKEKFVEEKGDILIIFALAFSMLLGFLAFVTDIGFAYAQRSKMMEIAQVMRDIRFTKDASGTELILHSNTPGYTAYTLMVEQARINGFKGRVTITYDEYYTTSNSRKYNIDIILEDTYECTTMQIFNIKTLPIKVKVEGSGYKETSGYNLWYPSYIDNGTRVSEPIE